MIKKLGLQLFTVRDYLKDEEYVDLTFEKLAKLGYTEAQTAGTPIKEEKYIELAHKHGIDFVGTHYSWDEIVNNPKRTIEVHKMWGTTNVGIGGMPGEARESYDGLKKFIAQFNKSAELYAKEGFKLTYHNHHFEFVRIDGFKTIMDCLYEGFDKDTTSFVLDTCWVAAGGGDVREWLEKLENRVDILHLKDLNIEQTGDWQFAPRMTEIGHGSIYWDGVLDTAEKTGVKHYVVEQDNYFIDNNALKSLEFSANYLKKYMK